MEGTSSVSYYKLFDFFLSQTSLSLTEFVDKYSNTIKYYQNIFNVRFNETNLAL